MKYSQFDVRTLAVGIFMAAVFLLGGGSRYDIASLAVLRPLSVIMLAAATIAAPWWRQDFVRPPLYFVVAAILLIGLQLVPLPPSLWQALPGREILVEVVDAAELDAGWRPLNMVPWAGWNALASMIVPLAMLALLGVMSRRQLPLLAPLLLGFVALSCLLGLLQMLGSGQNQFYTYRITNVGSAVGLFANRNHQALLLACSFPLLAAASCIFRGRFAQAASAAFLVLFLPFLLVSGSRTGVVLGAMGILIGGVIVLDGNEWMRQLQRRFVIIGAGLAALVIAALIAASVWMSRAESLDRLNEGEVGADFRFVIWPQTWKITQEYLPWGAGFGSYEDIFKLHEPASIVGPKYVNHAHNEVLELALVGGIPALLLGAAAILAWLLATLPLLRARHDLSRPDLALARAASACLLFIGLHSIVDYPLRTPIFMMIATLCAVWLIAFHRAGVRMGSRKAQESS